MSQKFRLLNILCFFLLLLTTGLSAQSEGSDKASKGKKIIIKQADKGYYQKSVGRNRLIGNVVFEHEGALMYCDSAWLFSKDNRIKAFENVRINQGDTLLLWGDYLEYSGNTRKAVVTGDEVTLKDREMTLITDRLEYDRTTDLAYYYTGGFITSAENELTSREGYYNSVSKTFNFKDSVVLVNPDYTINSDTLIYSSDSRFAYFHGPTTITSDSSYIYCENGVYNTVQDIAKFQKNAYLYDDNKYLTGDSLYYEKHNQVGEAFKNVYIHDTVENYVITGGYGKYIGANDSTFVTLDPIYSIVQEEDTLHIHGDTLFSVQVPDTINDYRQVKVFHNVLYYKSDLQGKCDSLTYSTTDSIIRMYYNPVVWSDSSQITGDTIYLTIRNEKLDSLKVYSNSFIMSISDVDKHNQIKGRRIYGKFVDNNLRRVLVNGNGQTVYFPKDEDEEYIGMNRAICSNIVIRLKDNEIHSITFLTKPEAKLYPVSEARGDLSILEGFNPRYKERPTSKKSLLTL